MLEILDHVQLAMPEGQEELARRFYVGVLGLSEVAKPEVLAKRGGCWFQTGAVKVHLGVMQAFRPATKAHPAFIVTDLTALRERCKAAQVMCVDDEPFDGFERLFVLDPFGNRIELMGRL